MNKLQAYDSLSPVYLYSKQDLKELAKMQGDEINEAGSAEQALCFLHKIKFLVEEAISNIEPNAIEEIKKGNDSAFGVKLKLLERRNYKFDNDAEVKRLEQELKERKEFLKGVKESFEVVNENGEVTTIFPPIIEYTEYIKKEF